MAWRGAARTHSAPTGGRTRRPAYLCIYTCAPSHLAKPVLRHTWETKETARGGTARRAGPRASDCPTAEQPRSRRAGRREVRGAGPKDAKKPRARGSRRGQKRSAGFGRAPAAFMRRHTLQDAPAAGDVRWPAEGAPALTFSADCLSRVAAVNLALLSTKSSAAPRIGLSSGLRQSAAAPRDARGTAVLGSAPCRRQ